MIVAPDNSPQETEHALPMAVNPATNIPGNPQHVTQNYYEVNFWGTCNVLINNVFATAVNVFTTPAGWFGMVFTYVLYCLLTGKKFVE